MPTEAELIQKAIGGDEDAFAELLKPYRVKMYRLVFSYCGNPDDAEDVLQDAIMRVYRGLPNFKGNSKLSTWLYRICVNTSLTFIKRRRAKTTVDIEDMPLEDTRYARPDSSAIESAQRSMLYAAIRKLPPRQRAVVMLRIQDLAYEEISVQLGITVNNAKVHFSNAVKKLKSALGEKDE